MMSIFVTILFILCPLLSLPFLYIGFKKDKKHKKIYLFVVSIFIALFSYIYRPTASEDLYKHHENTMAYHDMNIDGLMEELASKPEQLSILYKYSISKTENYNLLQFFSSIICFFLLLYLLDEFSEKNKNIRGFKKASIWFFVLSGFHFIVITSGIFYTLALEIFSTGVYMDYEYGRKKIGLVFYILPCFIHTCAILPAVIIMIYKILGSKVNKKNIATVALLVLSIDFLLFSVAINIDLPIISELFNMHDAYFNNEEQLSRLHTITVLTLYLSKLLPMLVACKIVNIKESIGGFSLFMMAAILVLYFQTSFAIRYIHIVILCGLPIIFKTVSNKKYGQLFCVMLCILGILQVVYQIYQLTGLGYFDLTKNPLTTNLITLLAEK